MFFISWRQTEESTTSWQQTPKPPRPGLTESTALSENHGLTRSISADRCVGWTWINYHTSAPITSLFLSVCSCCWESSGAVVIHVHPHDTSLSVDWDFCLLVEKWMILVKKKITKAEMKINSTANFSQIRQQVPHTGTSGFEPQLVTHEKICTSLENDQCSNTEHQTKPFMHTSWNQAISAAPLCTNRASVCLSVSVSHRTQDCYCWMVLYLFDLCGFHVVLMWHAGDMKIF